MRQMHLEVLVPSAVTMGLLCWRVETVVGERACALGSGVASKARWPWYPAVEMTHEHSAPAFRYPEVKLQEQQQR